MDVNKIALFIDADNISAKFGKQIIDTLSSRGEIFIRRIYGNWEKSSLHSWNECILNFSLRAIQQPDYVAGKNATDMSLTIDAMDVLYGGRVNTFVLVSNDSDFTPLVIRLREGGMKIIGMGNAQVANSFRAACDEFIYLDTSAEVELPAAPKKKTQASKKKSSIQMNLFDENKPVELKTSPAQILPASLKIISITDSQMQSERDKKLQQIHDILHETTKLHGDDSGFSLLNCAGTELKSKNLGFTVRDFGYGQLKDFIAAFPKLYELKESGTTIFYRCLGNGQKIPNASLQQVHKVLRETAKAYGNEKGFVDLGQAGNAIAQKNLNLKGSGHSKLSKFISAFPNLYELDKNSYCCR